MTAANSGELTAAAVIASIESGAYSREVVATIARGFLPLAQEDLIAVLAYVAAGDDSELAALAKSTFTNDVPTRAVFEFASNENASPEHLLRLLRLSTDNFVLEALIRNRSVSDEAIAQLATTADARVQEVIVINQARILRAPEILEALLANASLSPDVRRRALETKEEFFEKKARLQQIEEENAALRAEEPEIIDVPLDAIADLLERAAEQDAAGENAVTVAITDSERQDPNKAAMFARINFMTVAEKVQLAFKGDRMVRMLLVRERNKLICSAVMRNPRMSETEVEQIAGMRNVEDEVLRLVSMRRDWMSKYNILLSLCRNPKTPIGVVLPLINRLTLRDLKNLKDDRGVQNVVREMSRKAYLTRSVKN